MADHIRSAEAAEYRKLYFSARWRGPQGLRTLHLRAHPLCCMCEARGRVTAAAVVDHIKPHKGDPDLFFDPGNVQSLCSDHHDRTKQIEEKRGYVIGCDADGRPKAKDHPWNRKRPSPS